MGKILGITGHREFGEGAQNENWIYSHVRDALSRAQDKGYTGLYNGMAPGVDITAGEIALSIEMDLHCLVPFPGFKDTSVFDEQWRERYIALREKATSVEFTAGEGYGSSAYLLRDRVLVDRSRAMVAVYDGRTRGGTYYTFKYANENGVPIYWINPTRGLSDNPKWLLPKEK